MKAELDRVNGTPVLRCEVNNGFKRNVFDLPLTPEQVRAIQVQQQAGCAR